MLVTRQLINDGDPISYPDGSVAANKTITFQLVDFDKRQPVSLFDAAEDGGEYVVGNLMSSTLNSQGYLTNVSLWPNNRGELATVYKVALPGTTIKPFYIQVVEGSGAQTLLSAKTAVDAVAPQTLSLFDALLANIIAVVNTATALATRTTNGLMSATDKVKLDDYVITGGSGYATLDAPSFTGLLKSAGNALFGKTVDDGLAKVQSSNGITLGNTPSSSALVLDYYLEGSFTPVLANFGGATASVSGTYTRIGRRIYATVDVVATAAGLTSNGNNSSIHCAISGANQLHTYEAVPFVNVSTSVSGGVALLQANYIFPPALTVAANGAISFSFHYEV